jgi:hypothetical protein
VAAAVLATVLAPVLALGVPPVVAAPAPVERPRAIIVLVDCATLADVTRTDLPGFSAMRAAGSMGLSTIPTGVGAHNDSAFATIGQGSPVSQRAVPTGLTDAFEVTETIQGATASALYERTTGTQVPAGASVVNPQIVALTAAYASSGAGKMPGVLGESLRERGLKAALVGDADGDSSDLLDRSASLAAMDASGAVPLGALGLSVDVTDGSAPLGIRTDFDRLFAETQRGLAGASLVVVETGDLQRARVEAPFATGAAAAAERERALRATDAFVARVAALASRGTLVLVISTSVPSAETGAGRSLAPVIIAGGTFPAGGALASATTRHEGVVTLHDLAPTVLAHLGMAPAAPMVGLRVSGHPDPHVTQLLATTLQRAGALHSQRVAAIDAFIALQTLLLLALCVPWVQRRVIGGPRAWWVLPYSASATALAIVLQPAIGSPALPVALGAIALITLAVASALAALCDRVLALGLLATATIGTLALDLAAGAPLARWSYLGYDIVVGGRFYGVGNEFEGVFIGASVLAAACLVALAGRRRVLAVAAVGAGCLGLIAMFALPRLGADAGGALAAAVGVGVTFYGFAGGRFTWRRVAVLVAALGALGVVGLAVASALGGGAGSHIGRFLARLEHGDIAFAGRIVLDKLKANLHLLAVSPWRSVFAAAAVAIGVLLWRERPALQASLAAEPDLSRGVPGLIAGGLAVLALNDSGVVAISTLAPFAVVLALTLVARGRTTAASLRATQQPGERPDAERAVAPSSAPAREEPRR